MTAVLEIANSQPEEGPAHALVNTGLSRRSVSHKTLSTKHPPKYVRKCPNRTEWQRAIPYTLLVWPPGHPEQAKRVQACCRSWRCEGECRRYQARVLWARLAERFDGIPEDELVYLVLTIDRNGRYSGHKWADTRHAYESLAGMTSALIKRLDRLCDRLGLEGIAGRWVAVVEAHLTGWPHVNLVLHSPGLSKMLRDQGAELDASSTYTLEQLLELADSDDPQTRAFARADLRERSLVRGKVLDAVVGTGWGIRSSAEVARSRGAVAGYLAKLCGLLGEDGSAASREDGERKAGELAKLSQVPTAAPQGFRRLRSGIGFLPARLRSQKTGALLDRGSPVKLIDLRRVRRRVQCLASLDRATERGGKWGELAKELAAGIRGELQKSLGRLVEVTRALASAGLPTRAQRTTLARVLVAAKVAVARPPPSVDDDLAEPAAEPVEQGHDPPQRVPVQLDLDKHYGTQGLEQLILVGESLVDDLEHVDDP